MLYYEVVPINYMEIEMTQIYCDRNEISKTVEKFDFNLTDEKGRKVGYYAAVAVVQYVDSGRDFGYAIEPGTYVRITTSPTRDGKNYGAVSASILEKTLEEALKALAKRKAQALKTYTKKYAK